MIKLNAFDPNWSVTQHLLDIVEFLSNSSASAVGSTDKRPALISNESRLAILAVAEKLLQLHKSGVSNQPIAVTGMGLHAAVLSLLLPEEMDASMPLTTGRAKKVCLDFIITQLVSVTTAAPLSCEHLSDKLLKLFSASER